jgi:hypothetical protein
VTDYTGLSKLLYDWQTIIAGALAIVAAVIGGGMAYRAGRIQANATRTAADLQVAAANSQLVHFKEEKEKDDQQANKDFIIALHAEATRIKLLARLKYATANRRHSVATNLTVTQVNAYEIAVTGIFRERRGVSTLRHGNALRNFIGLLANIDELNALIEVKGLLLGELQARELLDALQRVGDQAEELQRSVSQALI